MLLECKNCGAPLHARERATQIKCRYCRTITQVTQMRVIQRETPRDFRPPPVWTPPANVPAPSIPHKDTGRAVGCVITIIAITTVLPIVVVLVVVFAELASWETVAFDPVMPAGLDSDEEEEEAADPVDPIDAEVLLNDADAIVCGQKDDYEARTVVCKKPVKRVAAVESCKLILRGCTVTEGIEVGGFAVVRIEGGVLRQKDDAPALFVQAWGEVHISGNAHVEGLVRLRNDAQLHVKDAQIKGRPGPAIEAKESAQIRLGDGALVRGTPNAIVRSGDRTTLSQSKKAQLDGRIITD